jgi:photosystem II stability/assembly factor-like uncharacterized protein
MLIDEFETNLREALLRQAHDVPTEVVARLRGQHYRPRGPRRYVVIRLAAVMALAGGVAAAVVVSQSAQPKSRPASLSWRLVSDVSQAWHVSQPPSFNNALSLSCPTASTCYTRTTLPGLVRLPSGGTFSYKIAMEVTHDGGATWRRGDLPADVSLANEQVGPIDCLSEDTCMTLVFSTSWHYEIAETTDGGLTWTTKPGPAAPLATDFEVPGGISCTSTTSCVLIGSYGWPSEIGQWDAEVTTDGGQTWTQVRMPARAGFPTPEEPGVRCFAGGNCITPGDYSTDGGRTWSEGSLPSGILAAWLMSCGDNSHCAGIAVESGTQVVIVTTDGGKTWTQLPGAGLPRNAFLSSLTCATASTCWTAGSTGTLMPHAANQHQHQHQPLLVTGDRPPQPILESTDDQGQTWMAARIPSRYGIIGVGSVSCSATTSCFAIAQSTRGLMFLSYGS